ncbi:CIC11C00000005228 [Sungouiella intermedia]|uniref:ribonuclease T2 n=1 Tax=Sungouiella intermedia TaxID=45354 RepID=A0A1L0GL28_9ASCO|nr:CIC11C00000005228 [[Candida] intermedia]
MVSFGLAAFVAIVSVASAYPTRGGGECNGLAEVYYPVQTCLGVDEYKYFSCNAPGIVSNSSCCYENYGIIMQTQFWDFNPDYLKGILKRTPERSYSSDVNQTFTIHGLWNDRCDGSYDQFCKPELEFTDSDNLENVIVNQFGRQDLYDLMIKYWINGTVAGSQSLWQHEYNKHGTCFNTLQPNCFLGPYTKFENAVAYYQKAVEVWSGLPTYKFLEQADIVPTTEKKYNLSDVQNALAYGHHGKQVYVGCSQGAISEIWYYHEVRGNVLNGQYKATDTLTKSSCPGEVWYLPK